MKYFILEDNPSRKLVFTDFLNTPGNIVTMCDSVKNAKEVLSGSSFDVLYLDHDLDGRTYVPIHESNAGYQLALWIANNNISGTIIIHSYNEHAVPEMLKVLPHARWEPFNPQNWICQCEPNERGMRPGVVDGYCSVCRKMNRTIYDTKRS